MDRTALPLIIGGLFILLGFASKKYPQLIAGYNKVKSLGKNEKKIVPELVKKGLITTGIVILVGGSLCQYWGLGIPYFLILFASPFILIIWMQIKISKMDDRVKKRSTWLVILFMSIFLICIIFLIIGYKSAEVKVSEDKIEISGVYGQDIPLSNVKEVRLVTEIPRIDYRSSGFALSKVQKGYFVTMDKDTITLYLHSLTPPYLKIKTKEDKEIYINYDDTTKVETYYNEIAKQLH